ncbi:hypothetical protein [Vibrio alfacsensis]|uniref:hypothetical protein n=1 Tax=Vibrio alfacsensis TaxID=1074311 RepID=UPI001BEDBCAD|nr:hypothetical protein [Vibrio alfacsensis]BCN26442.1 hypothetical protein VYA_36340 [Vibrio alfacsensis]
MEWCVLALIAYKKPAINGGLLMNHGIWLDNQGLLLNPSVSVEYDQTSNTTKSPYTRRLGE